MYIKVGYISFESQKISTFPSLSAPWFHHHHHQLTHHHPLYVDLHFQLLDRLSGICNLGHVVGHPALFPPMSASLQHTSIRWTRDNSVHHRSRRKKTQTWLHLYLKSAHIHKHTHSKHSVRHFIEGICAMAGVCFNLLVNSAPWVSAARGTGRVSKEEGRGGKAGQLPQGRPSASWESKYSLTLKWTCCAYGTNFVQNCTYKDLIP